MFGLDHVVFRPHNVFGERQNVGDRYRNVVGIFMNQVLQGQPMTVFGDGEQQRAFTHVNDVAPIIAESVDVPAARNQVFNVGADVPITVNELARMVAGAFDTECRRTHVEPRNEVKLAFADHSKAERVFGRPPQTSLEEGIRSMARWVRDHGARKSGAFKNIEIRRNLPRSWEQSSPAGNK
jgi:UDP-glucose 4-epimerase